MPDPSAEASLTKVDYAHSAGLPKLLHQLNISLLISTYQAGKVISVGTSGGSLSIQFHHFEQAMGLARTPTGLAVGAKRQIWYLEGAPDIGPKIAPAGTYDVAFLTRRSHFTGPIMGHEMGWGQGELWVVNTGFSCLCTIDPRHNFVPRWTPPFISSLTAEDRCHLNGLAMEGDRPRYVSALGETDSAAGWRANKAEGGCLIDVSANEIVVRGRCMPHSPRLCHGQLLFLDSGRGNLSLAEPTTGQARPIVELNGYARGMDIIGEHAFIGLSKIRETSVFGGLPIAARRTDLRAGVAVVDLSRGTAAGFLHFQSGVDEVFEVKIIPGYRNPLIAGPLQDVDQMSTIWLSPALSNS